MNMLNVFSYIVALPAFLIDKTFQWATSIGNYGLSTQTDDKTSKYCTFTTYIKIIFQVNFNNVFWATSFVLFLAAIHKARILSDQSKGGES